MNLLLQSLWDNNFGWTAYFWPLGWRNAVWMVVAAGGAFLLGETVEFLIDWRSRRGSKES